jgi:copper chaperone CopZ
MTTLDFTVPSINCDHCVNTIRRAVMEVPGVHEVTGDPATKHVAVRFDPPATRGEIVAAMTEWDHPPAE